MSHLLYEVINILIPIYQSYPWFFLYASSWLVFRGFDPILFDRSSQDCYVLPRCVSLILLNLVNGRILFEGYPLVFYHILYLWMTGRLRHIKEVRQARHLCCHLSVGLGSILDQRIKDCPHSLGQHLDHVMVTLIYLLSNDCTRVIRQIWHTGRISHSYRLSISTHVHPRTYFL